MSTHTRVRFGRITGMLIALALFGALPAVAMAQGTSPSGGGGTVSSGNTQTGTLNQSASAGAGGNAGNQGAIVQQNAGRDANASVNQTQNFSSGGFSGTSSVCCGNTYYNRGYSNRYYTPRSYSSNYMRSYPSYSSSYNRAYSAPLAYTGFEAWVLALVGGASIAGGLGMLAARRRTGLSS